MPDRSSPASIGESSAPLLAHKKSLPVLQRAGFSRSGAMN
ncbi:hypothetical protein ATN83_2135 [Raoultella ornithinolytica]|nr:hypothetical protein ATN83_2135 [Raoultella ornithinolytica]